MRDMPIQAKSVANGMKCFPPRRAVFAAALSGLLLAGCQTPTPQPRRDLVSIPDSTSLSLREGVPLLAARLVAGAGLSPSSPRTAVVIDPWIDVATGSQVATTRLMQQELETLAPQRFPQIELLAFTPETLARRPVVLLGAIVPVSGPGAVRAVTGRPGAWLIRGLLANLRSGRIAAVASVWVRPEDVDATPVPFYRDSPIWQRDESALAYLRTLEARPGDPIDPAYVQNLRAEALVVNANAAYGEGQYEPARDLYRAAAGLPDGGHQLRVYNGLYLTNQALGDRPRAMAAFAGLVDRQIARGRLSVKFLFRPNSTSFWPDPAISASYGDWLRVIARRVAAEGTCLRVIGHTSATGSAQANDRLSLARATRIRRDMTNIEPSLEGRVVSRGFGSREPIVGTGRDDATDLLDRRVDFQMEPCARMADAGP